MVSRKRQWQGLAALAAISTALCFFASAMHSVVDRKQAIHDGLSDDFAVMRRFHPKEEIRDLAPLWDTHFPIGVKRKHVFFFHMDSSALLAELRPKVIGSWLALPNRGPCVEMTDMHLKNGRFAEMKGI